MSSWRYISPDDPNADLDYSLRADARLRMAYTAHRISVFAAGYVGLVGDDTGPSVEHLSGVADMTKLLADLKDATAMHVLAAGGTYKEIGYALDISEHAAEHLFAEKWADRQAEHAEDNRTPIDPRTRHLMRDLSTLDAWRFQYHPEDGRRQVTDGLVWPHAPGAEVRTVSETEDAAMALLRDAENTTRVAAYIAERDALIAKAMKKLARRPGLAHTSLWGKDGAWTEYVVARDGRYLGRVRKANYDSPQIKGVRWHIEDGPGIGYEQKDQKYEHLADAIGFLDRNSPTPDTAGD